MHDAAQHLASEARSKLGAAGYDGAVYKNEIEGGTSYVVFSPKQIKSPFKATSIIAKAGKKRTPK